VSDKQKLVTRQLVKHVPGCPALQSVAKGIWKSPWVLPKFSFERVDKLLRRNDRTSNPCMTYRCNSQGCPAKMLVLGDFSHLLPHGEEADRES